MITTITMQTEAAATVPLNHAIGDEPNAARQRANELRAAGQAFGEAIFNGVANGREIVETLERGFAELAARLDRLTAAIAEQPAAASALSPRAGAETELPAMLTVYDVARFLRISPRTVRRKLKAKEIPDPVRLEVSDERKEEAATERREKQGGDAEAKAKPKGKGLGKALWRRETILEWFNDGMPAANAWKPRNKRGDR